MKLNVYQIKTEYQLKSETFKRWLENPYTCSDKEARYNLIVAESKEQALGIFSDKYQVLAVGGIYANKHWFLKGDSIGKAYVTEVDITIEEVEYSIDTLKAKLTADDFMKYFTYKNMEYSQLFK